SAGGIALSDGEPCERVEAVGDAVQLSEPAGELEALDEPLSRCSGLAALEERGCERTSRRRPPPVVPGARRQPRAFLEELDRVTEIALIEREEPEVLARDRLDLGAPAQSRVFDALLVETPCACEVAREEPQVAEVHEHGRGPLVLSEAAHENERG